MKKKTIKNAGKWIAKFLLWCLLFALGFVVFFKFGEIITTKLWIIGTVIAIFIWLCLVGIITEVAEEKGVGIFIFISLAGLFFNLAPYLA